MADLIRRARRKARKLYTLSKARAAARSGRVDHPHIFCGTGDELWFSLNTIDYRSYPELRAVLPSM